jgi:hypothetical protein
VGYDITSDSSGNMYVTGYTLSLDFPQTPDAIGSKGGGTQAFLTKLNASGAGVYSTFLGDSGTHIGYGLAASNDGTIYVGGLTNVQDIFVTSNANQLNYGGGLSDGFLIVVGQQ